MRILVYRYGQIGDTVATIPSLWALRRHFPDGHITMLSEIPSTDDSLPPEKIIPQSGLIDEYLRYQGGVSLRRLFGFAMFFSSLRRSKYDVLVYLVPSTRDAKRRRRDAIFFRLAGLKSIIGMRGFPEDSFPRRPDGSLIEVANETDALLARLALDGIAVPDEGAAVADLAIAADERGAAKQWWVQHVAPTARDSRWFAVCPGSKWASKRWPLECFIDVARRLWVEQQLLPVVLGGVEDRALGLHLVEACGAGACAAGELSVRESAALLERATLYLGNDSGPMHLAAAVGTPCVAVFSAQDWKGRWHPYGRGHELLRVDPPCAGCFSPNCPRQLECLTSIQPSDVYAAALRILGATEARKAPAAGAMERRCAESPAY